MTISEMSNAELDRLIAERRGWEYSARGFEVHIGSGLRFPYKNKITGKFDVRYPSFTTDPRYAMELLKEMAEHHVILSYEKNWNLMPDDQNMYWIVHFPLWLNFTRIQRILTYADTPERAISEAWLTVERK